MDEQRKHAYRYLLYNAMLNIRGLQWMDPGWRRRLRPNWWRTHMQQARIAGAVADWLHNLAKYSAVNFYKFEEEWFWRDYKSLLTKYPNAGLEHYRAEFDRRASSIDPPKPSDGE